MTFILKRRSHSARHRTIPDDAVRHCPEPSAAVRIANAPLGFDNLWQTNFAFYEGGIDRLSRTGLILSLPNCHAADSMVKTGCRQGVGLTDDVRNESRV